MAAAACKNTIYRRSTRPGDRTAGRGGAVTARADAGGPARALTPAPPRALLSPLSRCSSQK